MRWLPASASSFVAGMGSPPDCQLIDFTVSISRDLFIFGAVGRHESAGSWRAGDVPASMGGAGWVTSIDDDVTGRHYGEKNEHRV